MAGIEYLHSARPSKPALLHQNISADKVLLDYAYRPLISGCGLHKLLVDDLVFSTLKASAAMGYLAPEYTTVGRLSEKSDVYAFGVIVLQVLAGKRKVAVTTAQLPSDVEELVDGNLRGSYSAAEAAKLAEIAVACTGEDPSSRPPMSEVLRRLLQCSRSQLAVDVDDDDDCSAKDVGGVDSLREYGMTCG